MTWTYSARPLPLLVILLLNKSPIILLLHESLIAEPQMKKLAMCPQIEWKRKPACAVLTAQEKQVKEKEMVCQMIRSELEEAMEQKKPPQQALEENSKQSPLSLRQKSKKSWSCKDAQRIMAKPMQVSSPAAVQPRSRLGRGKKRLQRLEAAGGFPRRCLINLLHLKCRSRCPKIPRSTLLYFLPPQPSLWGQR